MRGPQHLRQGRQHRIQQRRQVPKEQISLTIARKGRSFLAKIVWWRDNFVGVAFSSDRPYELPVSDIEERLRKSEKKKRQLQRRINELLGEG